jgi:hypothetical protein
MPKTERSGPEYAVGLMRKGISAKTAARSARISLKLSSALKYMILRHPEWTNKRIIKEGLERKRAKDRSCKKTAREPRPEYKLEEAVAQHKLRAVNGWLL